MQIQGTYTFDAPRTQVWTALQDPAVIASCVPGCQSLEPDGPDCYRANLTVAIAAITGSYEGTVTIKDAVAPDSYRLVVEGQGRPGFVKGETAIVLRDEGSGTVVDVTGTVEVGGTIARVGQRLLGSVSKMMLDRFFGCLQSKVTRT